MKRLLILQAALAFVLFACNSGKNKDEVTITSEDGNSKVTIESNKYTEAAEVMQKKAEELQKLSPYSLDQMKAMLPEELAGAKRSRFTANSTMGASFAEAEYKLGEDSKIELKIFDCAGQAGAGIYSMQFLGMMNFQSETDDEYTRTTDYKGKRAIEHAKKDGSRATFSYLAADRLFVTLEGRNTGIDKLRDLADNLRFN